MGGWITYPGHFLVFIGDTWSGADPGIMPGGDRNSRKTRKKPGSKKGAFIENRVKAPDPIRSRYCFPLAKGARFSIFRSWADFPCG